MGSDESSGKNWSDLEEEAAKGIIYNKFNYNKILADKDKERGEDRHGKGDRKRKGDNVGSSVKRRH